MEEKEEQEQEEKRAGAEERKRGGGKKEEGRRRRGGGGLAPHQDGLGLENLSGHAIITVINLLDILVSGRPWRCPSLSSSHSSPQWANHRYHHFDRTIENLFPLLKVKMNKLYI